MISYGTTPSPADADAASDLERASGSGLNTPATHSTGKPEFDNQELHPLLDSDRRSIMSERSHESAQAGVKRLEAISSTWSRTGLYVAYVGIAMLAYATSLEGQTTTNLTIYATSAFKAHSLVSTVLVVQGVVLSIVKPPMSKVADVFGRFEAFALSVLFYIVGFIQQASSTSVDTYAAAQIFYSAGTTGLQILIQIFIADTSDLVNRALCSTLPDIPFLANVWLGPALAEKILRDLNWRWGYGIWAVVLPVAFLPLALALVINQRKAAMRGILPESPFAGESWWQIIKTLWFELDFFGLVLICVAFTLILIPLTLGAKVGWKDPSLLTMLVIGATCLVAIPFWERSKTLAPRAFFPRTFWKNKTIMAGLALSFFYFSKLSPSRVTGHVLTVCSGILPIRVPVLPVVPACGTESSAHAGWPYRANLHLHLDHHVHHHLFRDQVHQAVQVLHGGGHMSVHHRLGTYDPLPNGRVISGYDCCDASIPRRWRQPDACAGTAWCSGVNASL